MPKLTLATPLNHLYTIAAVSSEHFDQHYVQIIWSHASFWQWGVVFNSPIVQINNDI